MKIEFRNVTKRYNHSVVALSDINVKIDKPYPEIVNAIDDFQTVAILKNLVYTI